MQDSRIFFTYFGAISNYKEHCMSSVLFLLMGTMDNFLINLFIILHNFYCFLLGSVNNSTVKQSLMENQESPQFLIIPTRDISYITSSGKSFDVEWKSSIPYNTSVKYFRWDHLSLFSYTYVCTQKVSILWKRIRNTYYM